MILTRTAKTIAVSYAKGKNDFISDVIMRRDLMNADAMMMPCLPAILMPMSRHGCQAMPAYSTTWPFTLLGATASFYSRHYARDEFSRGFILLLLGQGDWQRAMIIYRHYGQGHASRSLTYARGFIATSEIFGAHVAY